MDFGAPAGTPIRTIGGGAVEFAGWQNGYGNVVEVRHSATLTTLYAHLSRIDVLTGQRVALGQHLGAVGATGWATGPHLHFEFRVDGAAQDPAFLARAAGSADLSDTSRWAFEAASTALRDELTASVQMARSHAVVE
jgi:murein DD-endopeptidase MepM/ murein hydrolase activator NlpD